MRLKIALLLSFSMSALQAQEVSVNHAWHDLFSQCKVAGTIVTYDSQTGAYVASDDSRFKQRFIPASTFKIPHTLFALDAGVATRQPAVYKWSGAKQPFSAWETDQTLSTAFRKSVPWVYQVLARQLGDDSERRYLEKISYGNESTGGGVDQFWLTGSLTISAFEQIGFLRRLESDSLPFTIADQLFVKDLMLTDAGPEIVLRAKSGWAFDKSPQIGWYVGWAEIGVRRIFFALNMTVTDGDKQLPCRSRIAREVIRRIGGA